MENFTLKNGRLRAFDKDFDKVEIPHEINEEKVTTLGGFCLRENPLESRVFR